MFKISNRTVVSCFRHILILLQRHRRGPAAWPFYPSNFSVGADAANFSASFRKFLCDQGRRKAICIVLMEQRANIHEKLNPDARFIFVTPADFFCNGSRMLRPITSCQISN